MEFLRSGRPSVDLVWTVRFRNVWPTETLTDADALDVWLRGTYPHVQFAGIDLKDLIAAAKELREAAYSLMMATICGDNGQGSDRRVINARACGERFVHELGPRGAMPPSATGGEQFLAELAVDAMDVLRSDPGRLRMCEGPLCSLPFLDESRSGTRRWCTAQRCGNRVNTKMYRDRLRNSHPISLDASL
jgi:predicted RNA-binding Zn ribbon-like protein